MNRKSIRIISAELIFHFKCGPTFVGFFVYRIGGIVLIIAIKLSLTSLHPENFIYHTSTADSIKQ